MKKLRTLAQGCVFAAAILCLVASSETRTHHQQSRSEASQVQPTLLWSAVLCPPATCSFGDPYVFQPTRSTAWLVSLFVTNFMTNDTRIVVLNASNDGAVVWTYIPTQTFPTPPYSGWCDGAAIASNTSVMHNTGVSVLVCGLDDGVVALDANTGTELWRFVSNDGPNAVTPAHPTCVQNRFDSVGLVGPLGFAVFTFENGHESSVMHAVAIDTGRELCATTGERVFTKIWSVAASLPNSVALCSISNGVNISVSVRELVCVQRSNHSSFQCDSFQFRTRWMHAGLPFSPPGLWDNPNLDVDAAALSIFMYEKQAIGNRSVKQFSTRTGNLLWYHGTSGHVIDYDTYAFQNNFFRLTSRSSSSIVVEGFNTSTNTVLWTTVLQCDDPNAILLVGLPPRVDVDRGVSLPDVAVIGLNSGSLWRFDASHDYALQWRILTGLANISSGVFGPRGTLMIGIGSAGQFCSFL